MNVGRKILLGTLLAICTSTVIAANDVKSPYGSGKFESYKDISTLKTLKAVWDFNFQDPKAVGMVFNNVAALMKATSEFGPVGFDSLKIVIVSHGPELVVWDKRNYAKYKDIVDRAASLAQQGVKFEVCRNAAAALGLKPEDLQGFITVIPAGPYALTYWQNKGYALISVGATMPTTLVTPLNQSDIHKK